MTIEKLINDIVFITFIAGGAIGFIVGYIVCKTSKG
jgi:hypothetical protein